MVESYDKEIGNFTNLVNKKLVYYLNTQLASFDITADQWHVLLNLSEHNKINQKVLANEVSKDQPTLTRILDILERKALVERHMSKEDRRSFSIHITEKGISLTKELIPFIENLFKKILCDISEQELTAYLKVLTKMDSNIHNLIN